HAYPGTEFYDYAKANGFIVNTAAMMDEGGHQMAHIEYPGLPTDYVLEMVHRFYDEYYFRPKAVFRIVRKAAFDSTERKRLYKEAKSFLKLRAARNRTVKEARRQPAPGLLEVHPEPTPGLVSIAPIGATGPGNSETAEPVNA